MKWNIGNKTFYYTNKWFKINENVKFAKFASLEIIPKKMFITTKPSTY
jgi:hypothetical protein